MKLTIYSDTNILSYCWEPPPGWTDLGLERLRAVITDAINRDELVLLGSQFHLEEASRIPDVDSRRRFFRYFWDTVRWALLLPNI